MVFRVGTRWFALALSVALASGATGCGGSSPGPLIEPPSSITYSANPAVYTVGTAISPNLPTHGGGEVASWSVTPALPPGLSLDPASGVIAGTPAAPSAETSFTITASNAGGKATVSLGITVLFPGLTWDQGLWDQSAWR